MNTVKKIGVIINNSAINYNLGVIALLLKKFKKEQLTIYLIITDLSIGKEIQLLIKLYKNYLNIIRVDYIKIKKKPNKQIIIDNELSKYIKNLNFNVLIAREQKNLIPISDRLIASIFKYKEINLLEDNLFGYYLDKNTNIFITKYYMIMALVNNIWFLLNNLLFIKNNSNIFKIFFPSIFTIRKKTKNRKSVFDYYKKIINKECILYKKNKLSNDYENIKALILLDLYHFKTNNHYSKKPSLKEIQKGIEIYLDILKKISNKFQIKESNIKFKLHPKIDKYLTKKIIKSKLGNFLIKNRENKMPFELTFNNYKNLKFCFSIASSSPIFLKDLCGINAYAIKTKEIMKEPNYIYINRLCKSKKIDFIDC